MSYLFQVFNSSFEIYISYWFSKSNPYPTIDFQNLTPTTLLIFKTSPYHTIDFQNLPPTPLDEGIASEYLQLGMWK